MPDHGANQVSDFLTPDDVVAGVEALSDDDKLKLIKIEGAFLARSGRQKNELLHEALARTFLGKRNCPRDVPVIAFVIETMKSIAHHDYKARKRESVTDPVEMAAEVASACPNPEELLLAAESKPKASFYEAMQDLLKDDDEAQLVLIGWIDDLRGKELRDAVGVTQAQLDYAIKRIRRKAQNHFPKGWAP